MAEPQTEKADIKKQKFPSEIIDLPSGGKIYGKDSPLYKGKIEIKYMTAKEEDILTNQSYIQKGTVIDKLLEALIVSKVDYRDLIIGDKNALLIAVRILGYGSEYEFSYKNEVTTVTSYLPIKVNNDFNSSS